MIMDSDFVEPLNLGSSELVSINQLVDMVEEIGGRKAKTELQSESAQRGKRS